ncbi:MAG TPA: Xaa-Pro peptidase family protein [Chloroflexia bacterium]|nr:Xaa-Pro peptidase family protein [Chloroflexia bacterium]
MANNSKGNERKEMIRQALTAANLDGLVCSTPANVLMLSGYWPVVGTGVALFNQEGQCLVLAPPGEEDLARNGWADDILCFEPGSLSALTNAQKALPEPLQKALKQLNLEKGRIGYEGWAWYEPASYSSMHFYGEALAALLKESANGATLVSAMDVIEQLKARLSHSELEILNAACEVAGMAFETGKQQLKTGLKESEIAANFRTPFSTKGIGYKGAGRADGFVYCMSGPNSAQAGKAFAFTSDRQVSNGDLVLVHCNSYLDGFWTDITRTFCLGKPSERQQEMYSAIFAAREAALKTIKPGVTGREVDKAARDILKERGFEKYFTHGVGHGVGFGAINHDALPRIHPASDDRLEVGMVFNVEPSIYIEGFGGMRHCDVITVTDNGAKVLTDFLSQVEQVILS